MVTRTHAGAVPGALRVDGRSSPANGDLCGSDDSAGDGTSHNHRECCSYPFLVSYPPCHGEKNQPDHNMCRPVTEAADRSHQILGPLVFVLDDPSLDGGIEIKAAESDQARGKKGQAP